MPRVSIPFIAGQWSLRAPEASARRCRTDVSIPFIAGQWSLRPHPAVWRDGGRQFQSPSLRGSGRFELEARLEEAERAAGFNPLHCGAVVASNCRSGAVLTCYCRVSIPFIAGQWSLLPRTTPLSFCGVRLRKRRLPCDHVLCTRLHVCPKPVILP